MEDLTIALLVCFLLIGISIIFVTLKYTSVSMTTWAGLVPLTLLTLFLSVTIVSLFISTISPEAVRYVFAEIDYKPIKSKVKSESYESIGLASFDEEDSTIVPDPIANAVNTPEFENTFLLTEETLRERAKENIEKLLATHDDSTYRIYLTEADTKNKTDEEIDELLNNETKDKTPEEIKEWKTQKTEELEEQEYQHLKLRRYLDAKKFQSDTYLKSEYLNPSIILPRDQWFKPEKGAKDIINAKPCMCPAELILTQRINYSKY